MRYLTYAEFRKHLEAHPLAAHGIWPKLKEYIPGWGYSKAQIDAFFEGESGGKKQVHWDRITSKPSTFPPSVHNILSTSHGDALVGSVARGDLIIGNSAPKWSRLAKGAANKYLKSNGTDVMWDDVVQLVASGFTLNTLVANNKVPDSDKVDGYHHNQSLLTSATPTFAGGLFGGNVGIGQTTFGEGATKVLAMGNQADHPTTRPANCFQMYSKDFGGAAGKACPHFLLEDAKVVALNQDVSTGATPTFAGLNVKLDDLAEPDDNFDLNVSTSRHGLIPKLPNSFQKFFNGIGQWTVLAGSGEPILILSVVSNNTRNSNDTERQSSTPSYVKLKETKMGEPTGKMRIYFEMKSSDGSTVYGRIYKNGSPIGTQRSTDSTDYVPFEEDLSSGLAAQDLIQIYAKAGTDLVYIRNLRFKYDRAVMYFETYELATPLVVVANAFGTQNQDP